MQAEIIAFWKIQSNYWSGIRNKTIKVHKVLFSPLIKITERAAKNLDIIKKLNNQSYLQTLNCFKTTVSLRRRTGTISLAKSSRQSFLKKRKLCNKKITKDKERYIFHTISLWRDGIFAGNILHYRKITFLNFPTIFKSLDLTLEMSSKVSWSLPSSFIGESTEFQTSRDRSWV